ncbi:hypothetical protein IWX90DRAFT_298993 [Phyllosticta citrichinensis]|uniref:Uncharacterized protein n=1 Tax=Phyllosticta citrichinensis TaxID=1130410 RepID=A0ABR1XKQ1_9PEZI
MDAKDFDGWSLDDLYGVNTYQIIKLAGKLGKLDSDARLVATEELSEMQQAAIFLLICQSRCSTNVASAMFECSRGAVSDAFLNVREALLAMYDDYVKPAPSPVMTAATLPELQEDPRFVYFGGALKQLVGAVAILPIGASKDVNNARGDKATRPPRHALIGTPAYTGPQHAVLMFSLHGAISAVYAPGYANAAPSYLSTKPSSQRDILALACVAGERTKTPSPSRMARTRCSTSDTRSCTRCWPSGRCGSCASAFLCCRSAGRRFRPPRCGRCVFCMAFWMRWARRGSRSGWRRVRPRRRVESWFSLYWIDGWMGAVFYWYRGISSQEIGRGTGKELVKGCWLDLDAARSTNHFWKEGAAESVWRTRPVHCYSTTCQIALSLLAYTKRPHFPDPAPTVLLLPPPNSVVGNAGLPVNSLNTTTKPEPSPSPTTHLSHPASRARSRCVGHASVG